MEEKRITDANIENFMRGFNEEVEHYRKHKLELSLGALFGWQRAYLWLVGSDENLNYMSKVVDEILETHNK